MSIRNLLRRVNWMRYVRIAVACLLLLILLPILVQPQFFDTFGHIQLPLALLAFVLSLVSVAAKTQRWALVLHKRGVNARYGYLLNSYFVGQFFDTFLPSGLGGDAVRAYDSARTTGKSKEAITAVILERGIGMLVVFGGGSLLVLFQPDLPLSIVLLAHGLFIGTLIGVFLLWQDFTGGLLDWIGTHLVDRILGGRLKPLWNSLVELYIEFQSYRHEGRFLGVLLLQAILTQAIAMMSLYMLIMAVGYAPPIGAFIAVTGIGTSLDLVPISLNSLGIREGVYIYFLGLLAIPAPVAAAFAVSLRLLALLQALIGGLIFVWRNVRPDSRAVSAPVNESVVEAEQDMPRRAHRRV